MSDPLHIVCPHCDGVNRVIAEKLGNKPICGKCRQALFNAHPVELKSENFNLHVGRTDIPVLIDFWAPWCAPCRMMAPAFITAAAQLEPHIRLAKVDTEQAQDIGARFNIRSIPTLALFQGGREIARQAGAMDSASIVRWVRSKVQ